MDLTSQWLDENLPALFSVVGGVEQEKVGWSFAVANRSGIETELRVLDVGLGDFMAELSQCEAGQKRDWSRGVGVPISTVEELRNIAAAMGLTRERV